MATIYDFGSPSDSLAQPSNSAWAAAVAGRLTELPSIGTTYEWRLSGTQTYVGTGAYTAIPGWQDAVFNAPGEGVLNARLYGWIWCPPGGGEVTVYLPVTGSTLGPLGDTVYYFVSNSTPEVMVNSMCIEQTAVVDSAGPITLSPRIRAASGLSVGIHYWVLFVEFSPYQPFTAQTLGQ